MRLLEVIKAHYKAFLVGAIGVIILIGAIIAIIEALKTARVNILVAPVDATIRIDGWRFSNGSHRVFPGKKHVEISYSNMTTVSFDIDCESGHTAAINRYLVGENNDFSYYTKSAKSYEILKLLADKESSKFINEQEQKLVIKDILPIVDVRMGGPSNNGRPYTETKVTDATGREECKATICLAVKTNSSEREKTLSDLLKYHGFKLEDYEVFYEE